MTIHKPILAVAYMLALGALLVPCGAAAQEHSKGQSETWDEAREAEARAAAQHGLDLMMNGELDASLGVFRQIQKDDPDSPLGYLLEADADWWKIYLIEGNLVDPDVFESISEAVTPYDPEFSRLEALTLQKAESRLRARQDRAHAYLYEGLAYALQARLEALRDHAWATARAGKKMRSLLLNAVRLDPQLYDAYLGLGLYNYFVDTLPTYVKMLRFLILLPGGDRKLGLEQLRQAAEKGGITRGEAKFHLAKDYSRPIERQYAKSQALFEQLDREYPKNPLWALLVASLQFRLDRRKYGEELYRKVYTQTAAEKSLAAESVHRAVAQALCKLHPDQKFE